MVKQYKNLHKQSKIFCRSELRAYENKIVGNCKSNPKLFYKYINDRVKVEESIKAISDENGVLITDPVGITDSLNLLI